MGEKEYLSRSIHAKSSNRVNPFANTVHISGPEAQKQFENAPQTHFDNSEENDTIVLASDRRCPTPPIITIAQEDTEMKGMCFYI